jgi:peptidoglycan/LPS O-acetylase OafA/YrhL
MYSMQRSELTGWPLVANFATRRIFRIYPLSIIAVLTALALHLDSDVNGIRGLSYGLLPGKIGIASNLLLIQNLTYTKSIVNVLWSLPFELQMYAFLPFIFTWIRGKRMFWPLLGLWAASSIAGLLQPHVDGLGRLSILAFVPTFLPGVIFFSLPYVPRFKSFLWPAPEIKTRWLRRASNIATYSYGIYRAHRFCIWIALGLLASHALWLRIAVLIVLLVGLPVLLYHTIERPMIELGIRIAARITEPRVLPSAAAAL